MKKTLYLYKSGTLAQKDYSLVLQTKNDAIYIPIQQIDEIICFSEITMNKRVLMLLNRFRVSISFFNFYGNYIGRYTPKEYVNGKVLVKQVNAFQNEQQRLYIAKRILNASLHNENSVLKYYAKKGRELEEMINHMEKYINRLNECKTVDELMLVEANAKQYYYSSFDVILNSDDYKFEKRSKNPPENEINAMLSYGYAILYSHYLAVLDRSSLHPQISFIHSLEKNCDSLQYDLADVTKSVIIDRLVLRLIRKRQISKDMFERREDRCYLNKKGVEFYVTEIDKQLQQTVNVSGKFYSYKSLISREVHQLSEYIKNEERYDPYLLRW